MHSHPHRPFWLRRVPRERTQNGRRRTGARSRRTRLLLAAALALSPILLVTAMLSTARASLPPTPSGWSLAFSDDFNGSAGSAPSTANWLYDLGHCYPGCPAGNWGTGEVENMTNSTANVFLDGGGNLAIKPIRDSAGNWTSGRIETQRTNFQPPAGGKMRIEGRLQMPNVTGAAAQGYWPAFWTLGAPFRGVYTNWPSVGEIDVMENVNGVNTEFGTLHCGVAPGGPCNEFNGLGGTRACSPSTCQAAFHTYAIELDYGTNPQQIRWYLDGVNFFTVNANQVDATTWANATNHGFFVILDVAIGGSFPGAPTGSTASGVPMLVDYVAVYTANGGGGTTTGPPPTTPGGGGGNARSTIQAESFNAQSGTQTETTMDTGGGQDVGWIANGDWLQYNNLNFGTTAARQFSARVASGAAGGVSGLVEVHLDSLSNPSIGSFAVGNTGGWQSWRTVPANISATTGTHTVFLRFVSGQPADFVNVNWLTFS